MHDHPTKFMVGLDVGSTTVKAIVVDAANDQNLWARDYERDLRDILKLQSELAQLKKTPSMQLLGRKRIPHLEAAIKQLIAEIEASA